MSNGGKGDDRRPTSVDDKTFSDNWERIFNGVRQAARQASNTCEEGSEPSTPAIQPCSSAVEHPDLTRSVGGSNPSGAAIALAGLCDIDLVYVDDKTGYVVKEDWWPGDPIPLRD